MIVTYSSNNSGGSWWLKDEDWKDLEANGWKLDPIYFPDKNGRSLGAIATSAQKEFTSIDEAIQDWERITGQCADDEGCHCCGQPHYFFEY